MYTYSHQARDLGREHKDRLLQFCFSTILIDTLYLRVAQMPRSLDLAIFVQQQQTKPITISLAHARGVMREKYY